MFKIIRDYWYDQDSLFFPIVFSIFALSVYAGWFAFCLAGG